MLVSPRGGHRNKGTLAPAGNWTPVFHSLTSCFIHCIFLVFVVSAAIYFAGIIWIMMMLERLPWVDTWMSSYEWSLCCVLNGKVASGGACSCFCRSRCEGRIKPRNEFVSLNLATLLAHRQPSLTRSALYFFCVNGWISPWCQDGRFSWRRTCSYKQHVVSRFCRSIHVVHTVSPCSTDIWWTSVVKLM